MSRQALLNFEHIINDCFRTPVFCRIFILQNLKHEQLNVSFFIQGNQWHRWHYAGHSKRMLCHLLLLVPHQSSNQKTTWGLELAGICQKKRYFLDLCSQKYDYNELRIGYPLFNGDCIHQGRVLFCCIILQQSFTMEVILSSCGNFSGWRFIVIKEKVKLNITKMTQMMIFQSQS